MRYAKLLIAVGALTLAAATANAQSALPRPNAFGLYFDGETRTNTITMGASATTDLFLVYTDPTIGFIDAWEVKVTVQGDASITDVALPTGSTALQAGPENWSVELSAPMPCNTLTKLAVFSLTVGATENIQLFLGNIDDPALAGDLPSVRVPDSGWTSLPVSSPSPNEPCAGINTTTPNETTSWGAVKSLFR